MSQSDFHINFLPREILIEVFRYLTTLVDRHNAMLVCQHWNEILQDACFMLTCPEILTIKYYEMTAEAEPFKVLYWSNRKFSQLRLNCLNWSDNDDQLMEQFFRHLGREARVVYYTDSLEWENFLTFFPKMTELRVDAVETLVPYKCFPQEFTTLFIKNLDPVKIDLGMAIFDKVRALKTSTRFKIIPDTKVTGLNILLNEELKLRLSQICGLDDVRIVTGANLLRPEPLSVRDILEIVVMTPICILIENLKCFVRLKKLTIEYTEDPNTRTSICKFGHENDTKCHSIKKVSFKLPRDIITEFCKTCFEIMLKSFPNLRSLTLENGRYPDRLGFMTLLAKYCPGLKVLKLLHKLSPHDHAITTPEGVPIIGCLKNLTKIHLYNLNLDLLRDWPMLEHLKDVTFIFVRFPEDLTAWKTFTRNSSLVRKLEIRSRFGLVEIRDPIESHRHVQEIVQGLKNLTELHIRFNKLTPESLEPISTYNRTLKRISFATMGNPHAIFRLEQVMELFKRISCLETFSLKFIYFIDGEYNEKCYDTFRWDYQSPRDHLTECIYQYKDIHASIAYIRAFLMPVDKSYKGKVHSLGSEDLCDVETYLGVTLVTEVANETVVAVMEDH